MTRYERKIRDRLKAWGCTNKAYLTHRTQHTKALNKRMPRRILTNPGYLNCLGRTVIIDIDWQSKVIGTTGLRL